MRKKLAMAVLTAACTLMMCVPAFAGQWIRDGYGWWFQNSDGSYPKSGIYTIENEDYAFDKYGYMVDNQWIFAGNHWYFCTGTGAIAKNMWLEGKYYVGSDGIMLTNTWTPDGYYVNELGEWDASKGRQGETAQTTEYFTMDGNWDNRDQNGYSADKRVDMWLELRPDDHYMGTMHFGLYSSTGTTNSLYDQNNPNGDELQIATVDGLHWGGRSTISDQWYELEYDGKDTIILHWRGTQWTNGDLVFKRRSGGSIVNSWDNGNANVPSNELETYSVYGNGVG